MKRAVADRFRTGGYGTTMWHHRLSCGHVVSRRRRSEKEELDCVECDLLEELPADDPVIEPGSIDVELFDEPIPVVDRFDMESRAKMALSSRVGVDQDAVRLVVDNGVVKGAVVFVDLWILESLIRGG